jgi:O-antigen/teichoic acid export membrane protein
VLRNASLYGVARLAPAAINFLALALYTRILSPAEYGRYALVSAASGFVIAVGFNWLRLGLIRFLPSNELRREAFLSSLLRGFLFVMAATLFLAVVGWLAIRDPLIRRLIPFGLALIWVQAAFELNLDLSVSRLQPVHYGLATIVRSVLGVASAAFLAWLGFGAEGVVAGLTIGFLVPLLFTLRRHWGDTSPRLADPELLAQLVRYGAPLIATLSLEFVVNASDRFLLGWLKGTGAVGAYAVGYDLSQQTLAVLMVTVNLAAWPAVIRALDQSGHAAAKLRLGEQGSLLALIALPSTAGLALLAPNIAHVLLGAEFQAFAARLIPLIALSGLIAGAKSYYFDLSFQLGKATSNQVWVMLAAAVTNIVCNLFWIPKYGAFGAAWATICAYSVGLVFSVWRGRYVFELPLPWSAWGKITAATALMALTLLPLRARLGWQALIIQILLGVLVFGATAAAANVLGVRGTVARFRMRRALGRSAG